MLNRLPDFTIGNNSLHDLAAIRSQMDRTREQMSSGRKILRPSDDPTGIARGMQLSAQATRSDRFVANAQAVQDEIDVVDSQLQSANDLVTQARDIALQGANPMNLDSRQALADQIRGIKDQLIAISEAEYAGIKLFSGTVDATQVFDPTTYTYNGNSGARQRTIDEGVDMTLNVPGDQIFGNGAASVFAALDELATALDTGNQATITGTSLGKLDSSRAQVLTARSALGARYEQASATEIRQIQNRTNLGQAFSSVMDVDLAQAVTDIKLQEVAYQTTLSALSRIIQPSLLDFLR